MTREKQVYITHPVGDSPQQPKPLRLCTYAFALVQLLFLGLKDFAARSLLLKLHTRGLVVLPPLRAQYQTRRWESRPPPSQPPPVATGIEGPLDGLQPLRWSLLLAGSLEEDRGHEHLRGHHYLGLHVVGENLKYLVQTRDGEDVACLLFGAAVWQSAARDKFIGWTAAQRAQGLSQVVNALAAKGSPIGTGAMESTCGQLQTRVKRTGQFWKPAGLTASV